ncbi:MAG: PPC domain-containing DNA-binding protein [Candidatus Micrarchaeota archaeon]
MEYGEGKIKRVFVLKFSHGEDLLSSLNKFVREKGISEGVLFLLGALKKGGVMAGPKESVLPPNPIWRAFTETHELLAVGTVYIYEENNEPRLHIHTAAGRDNSTLVGCLRETAQVFLIVEGVLLEFEGTGAIRSLDKESANAVLSFKKP